MTIRILGVHGVWNHKPTLTPGAAVQKLSAEWRSHLPRAIAERADLITCYYAHHLNTVIPQGGDDLDHLSDDAYAALVSWAAQLDAVPTDTPQALWSIPARMIVDKIAEKRGLNKALLRPFVAVFLREIRAYFRPSGKARTEARHTVCEAIRAHQPHVVVAHSLGSVVTYETLCAWPDLSVDLLITMGSPLGMDGVIFDRLQPPPNPEGQQNRPPGVRRWVNVADPGDIVAIPMPFTRRFGPDDNFEDVHIDWFDFHSSGRYLASQRTMEAMLDYTSHGE